MHTHLSNGDKRFLVKALAGIWEKFVSRYMSEFFIIEWFDS